MFLELLTPPAVEPLTVAECKTWARIDGTAFDAMLPGMIVSARQVAEHELGAKLITQVWRLSLDDWPDPAASIALFPAQSVALSYWNGSSWVALVSQAVTVRDKFGVYIRTTVGGAYASLVTTTGPRVRADVTVGYGVAGTDVPNAIRQFIAAHVAYWVRNPEAALERQMVKSPFLASLLDPFRTFL